MTTEPRTPEQLELQRELAWNMREHGDLLGAFMAMDAIASEAIHQMRLDRRSRERAQRTRPSNTRKRASAPGSTDEQRARQLLRPHSGHVDNVIPIRSSVEDVTA